MADKTVDPGDKVGPITFLRQVGAELRKVHWPTRSQVWNYFIIVLAFVLVFIVLVAALDAGFGKAIFWLFGGGADSPAGSG